jgi:hypothetical protein
MAEHWWTRLKGLSLETSRFPILCLLLVALSAADILMTYVLLRLGPLYYESNPLAHWFFVRWDIAGMIVFKFGVVAFVITIGEFVERRRRGWGRSILVIGCLATAIVIGYGGYLYWNNSSLPVLVDWDASWRK